MSWRAWPNILCLIVAGVTTIVPVGSVRAQTSAPPADAEPEGLDPTSPMAPLPELGVDWPDLTPGAEDAQADASAGQFRDIRYDYKLAGLDGIADPLFLQRFEESSTLRAGQDAPANGAQLDRRAREDAELVVELLRAKGFYAARVDTGVERAGDRLTVTLTAMPGPVFRVSAVDLAGIDQAGPRAAELRRAFSVNPEDPLDADKVAAAEARLRAEAGEQGFPFARIGDPVLTVDHATNTARVEIDVATGNARRFGRILTPPNRVFDADHIADIARFDTGDLYDVRAVDDLQRAIVQTGLVSSVRVTPVPGEQPDVVDLSVVLERAPPRTIAGELGYGTGEGARSEISWTHRNLFPPEGALSLRAVAGTQEQLGSVVFRRNNFHGGDRVLTAQLVAAHLERDAFEADTLLLSASLERQTNIFFQKTWAWSIGAELAASDERDVILATGEPRRRVFFIAAAPTTLTYDGSDDLLNPTRGFRIGTRVSPEFSLSGKAFGYARVQFDVSGYYPVSDAVVLAGRVRLGTIGGAPRDAIAPSRRFYAGGGASVRGYGFQDIGPRDLNNDPIGGRSLAEFALEGRIKAFGNFGIVPFLDGGNIYTSALPGFSRFQYGAGVGARYYSSFGPIRVDVGTPINPQPGDPRVAVYVSLGQAF